MRHAKSDWDAPYDGDHERPLNRRGTKAAARMGRFLAASGPIPERVWCSTAVRARRTVEIALDAGRLDLEVELFQPIYGASPAELLSLMRICPDETERLLVVGHEPGLSLLAGALAGGSALRFPTAALVRIDCAIDSWSDLRPGVGRLAWHVTPKIIARAMGAAGG